MKIDDLGERVDLTVENGWSGIVKFSLVMKFVMLESGNTLAISR